MASLLDLLHGLTKVGVVGPDGRADYFDNLGQQAKGYAKKEMASVQPGTEQPTDVQVPSLPFLNSQGGGGPDMEQAAPSAPLTESGPQSGGYQEQAPDTSGVPSFLKAPSFSQAGMDQYGNPRVGPALTKKGALVSVLLGGLEGGLAAGGTRTAGEGFQAAQALPFLRAQRAQEIQRGGLENQLTQAQIQNLPWQRAAIIAGLQKTQADTNKATAEGQKATAEAGRIPAQRALDDANALKAQFHDVDGVTYHIGKDASGQPTMTPVDAGSQIPVQSDEIAKVLNVKVGDNVPLSRQLKAADLITKGSTNYTTGEGVFEKNRVTGKTTRLGTAPAIASINLQQGPLANTPNIPQGATGDAALVNIDPSLADTVRFYGGNHGDLSTFMGRMNPASRTRFISLLQAYNPAFKQYNFDVAKGTAESAATGAIAQQANAFNTTIQHFGLLDEAVNALNNNKYSQFINKIGNEWVTQFGNTAPTDFATVKQVATAEFAKAAAGMNVAEGDRVTTAKNINDAQTPAQLHSELRRGIQLLKGKMDTLQYQQQRGENPSQNMPLVSPEAQKTMDKLLGGAASQPLTIKLPSGRTVEIH